MQDIHEFMSFYSSILTTFLLTSLSAMVSLRDHGGIGRRAALKMRSP